MQMHHEHSTRLAHIEDADKEAWPKSKQFTRREGDVTDKASHDQAVKHHIKGTYLSSMADSMDHPDDHRAAADAMGKASDHFDKAAKAAPEGSEERDYMSGMAAKNREGVKRHASKVREMEGRGEGKGEAKQDWKSGDPVEFEEENHAPNGDTTKKTARGTYSKKKETSSPDDDLHTIKVEGPEHPGGYTYKTVHGKHLNPVKN
jgi:hypothetical protein